MKNNNISPPRLEDLDPQIVEGFLTKEQTLKKREIDNLIKGNFEKAERLIKEMSKSRWVYYVCGCIHPYATESSEATMGCPDHKNPILKISSLVQAKYRIINKIEVYVVPGTTLKKKESWFSVHEVTYDEKGFPDKYRHIPVNRKQYKHLPFLVNIFKKTGILPKEEVEFMLADTILTEADLIRIG